LHSVSAFEVHLANMPTPHESLRFLWLVKARTGGRGHHSSALGPRTLGFKLASVLQATDLEVPDKMRLASLPPYSPEFNSTDCIWEEIWEEWFQDFAFRELD
jgi:hypothetical protein